MEKSTRKEEAKSFFERVCVLGPRNLQNELLCHVLERELGSPAEIFENIGVLQSAVKKGLPQGLLFIDGAGASGRQALETPVGRHLFSAFLVALFNLKRGLHIEPKAVKLGVRGFFYEEDNLGTLLKGTRLMLGGEVWLSRQILVDAVINGKDRWVAEAQLHSGLSPREIELLVLVSAGASNRDIAGKLFISENTVKTHLYNIFKKIKVPNRLQAALWITKNLEM